MQILYYTLLYYYIDLIFIDTLNLTLTTENTATMFHFAFINLVILYIFIKCVFVEFS